MSPSSSTCRAYVDRLIAAYCRTSGTLHRARPADRRLAAELHDRGVPLEIVASALLLATARRTLRPETAPPLEPVRSLHYYLPVIEELLARPPAAGFLRHLADTLERLGAELEIPTSPRLLHLTSADAEPVSRFHPPHRYDQSPRLRRG
jgi:hypothetical protein